MHSATWILLCREPVGAWHVKHMGRFSIDVLVFMHAMGLPYINEVLNHETLRMPLDFTPLCSVSISHLWLTPTVCVKKTVPEAHCDRLHDIADQL